MTDQVASSPYDILTVTPNPAIDRTLTISHFGTGKVNRVEQMVDHAGGKGVNVAVTLADDGQRVAATGLLGQDNSALFEQLFQARAIADA